MRFRPSKSQRNPKYNWMRPIWKILSKHWGYKPFRHYKNKSKLKYDMMEYKSDWLG